MATWGWILLLLLALGAGLTVGYFIARLRLGPGLQEARLRLEAAQRELGERDQLDKRFQDTFAALSNQALKISSDQFLQLAEEKFKALSKESDQHLESKKKLIDANLQEIGTALKALVDKSTKLEEGLASSKEQTEQLRSTTDGLRQVLSSSQARGKWGERMVEDILQLLGLEEGINYQTQVTLKSGSRPDFTFLLPKSKKINLDVKFPIDQYEYYIEAESESDAHQAKRQFLADVKNHIKDVAGRGYVSPADGTVDYAMVFIPNEAIYGFIHQNDAGLLDYALEQRIILCSPITLYAVLSLVRQAVRNFAMEEKAGEIFKLLELFQKQWTKYTGQMDKLGRSLESTQRDYQELVTTRSRQLDKPLDKIQELQTGRQQELLGESANPPSED